MLLKDFYIDKFCKKIKEAEPLPDTEYKQGLVDGLEYAIGLLKNERSDGQTEER